MDKFLYPRSMREAQQLGNKLTTNQTLTSSR